MPSHPWILWLRGTAVLATSWIRWECPTTIILVQRLFFHFSFGIGSMDLIDVILNNLLSLKSFLLYDGFLC